MAAARGSYPHPVLDDSDDVASTFEVFNVSITPSVEDVEVFFQVRMTDPDIKALLDGGRARYRFRWSCSSTIDGGVLDDPKIVHYADSVGYTCWIDQRRIRRTVRVEVVIVAAEELPLYHLSAQHPDYGDATFHVHPGDLLADGGSFEFRPDKLFDPLNPPVGSCFRFVPNPDLRKGLRVRFHQDDQVLVEFPEQRLAEFGAITDRPELQISLVVLPALMEAITYIRQNADSPGDEDLSDRLWHRALTKLIDATGLPYERPFEVAQKILGNPVDLVLTSLMQEPEEEG